MYRYLKFLHITDFFLPRVHLWFRWQISGMYWQSRVLQKPLKCIRNRHQFRISTNSTKKRNKVQLTFSKSSNCNWIEKKSPCRKHRRKYFHFVAKRSWIDTSLPLLLPPTHFSKLSQSFWLFCLRCTFILIIVLISNIVSVRIIMTLNTCRVPSFIAVQSNLSRSALVTMLPTSFESWNSVSGFSD